MAAQKKYPDELRERAVKMVLEIRERRVRATASWPGSHVSWVFTRRRLLADRPISRHTACVLQPPPPPALPLRQIRPGVARPVRPRPRVRTTAGAGRPARLPGPAGSGAEPPPRIPRTPGRAPRTLDREPQRARNRVRCHGLAPDLSPPSRRRTAAVMRARAAVDRYDALTARAGVDNGLEPWQTTTTGRPGRRHLGAERTRPKSPHPYVCPLCPISTFLVSDLDRPFCHP